MKSADAQSDPRRPRRGGARAGAGRKPKAVLLAGSIERIKGDIDALAPLVGPSLRELVEGIYVEETDARGTRRVYRQPPNLGALQTVIDRTLGKLGDRHVLVGDRAAPIIITVQDEAPPLEPEVER
ncbi:MAG: hypothetical protein KGK07_12855 [Chloroflexota bacterium]|nr:hypothetical protein [Chloroflexota bacterium]